MAKPIKIKNRNGTTSYRIFIQKKIHGKIIIENKTFSTASFAQQWHDKRVKELEYESIHGKASDDLIGEIIARYQDQYANSYGRSKNYDIARLLKHPIAEIPCAKSERPCEAGGLTVVSSPKGYQIAPMGESLEQPQGLPKITP